MSGLPVYEIFGPTIQGEGMYCGQRTVFLRLAGCDYRCAWCDTEYAQSVSQARQRLSAEEIVQLINKRSRGITSRVTITGGNPCIHDLDPLVSFLHQERYKIHIETQGSVFPQWIYKTDHICLSPKPPSSGNVTGVFSPGRLIGNGAVSAELKVVVATEEDYLYARELHRRYREVPFTLQACTTGDLLPVLKWLVDKVSADPGFNDEVKVLPQLHVLMGIK